MLKVGTTGSIKLAVKESVGRGAMVNVAVLGHTVIDTISASFDKAKDVTKV